MRRDFPESVLSKVLALLVVSLVGFILVRTATVFIRLGHTKGLEVGFFGLSEGLTAL